MLAVKSSVNRFTILIAVFAVLTILMTGIGFANFEVKAAASNYTVSASQIYKDGQPIQLRGLNWFGFEESGQLRPGGTWTSVKWTDMLDQMQSMGFNAVRVPFCPDTLTNSPVGYIDSSQTGLGSTGQAAVQVLDNFLNELDSRGMYFLLDHHRPDCVAISELWYTPSYSEQDWIDDLVKAAERYDDLEYFMGIDLSNEPHGATWGAGNPSTDWNKAAERAGLAVHAANPNILIFVEGVGPNDGNPSCNWTENTFWGENLVAVACDPINTNYIPANKLVYSPHVYGPAVATQSYFSAGNFPNNMPSIWQEHWGYLHDQGHVIAIGEWGGTYVGNDKTWQDAFVDYLIDKDICNTFHWSWNPNSGDTGGIVQNDWQTPEADKLANIQRLFSHCDSVSSSSSSSSTSTTTSTFTTTSSTSSSTSSSSSQSPFYGTPIVVPDKIEAEDFDNGNNGVAYLDNDALNQGGSTYRTTEVDIADYGGGRNVVSYTEPGEWLEYTIDVAQTGNYGFQVYAVTADTTDRQLSAYIDGNLIGTFTVPVQVSWDDFVYVNLFQVNLTAGEHTLRIEFDDYGINLDHIAIDALPIGCRGDYDNDGTVEADDFSIFRSNYKSGSVPANLDVYNSDNLLNAADLSKLASVYESNVCIID